MKQLNARQLHELHFSHALQNELLHHQKLLLYIGAEHRPSLFPPNSFVFIPVLKLLGLELCVLYFLEIRLLLFEANKVHQEVLGYLELGVGGLTGLLAGLLGGLHLLRHV